MAKVIVEMTGDEAHLWKAQQRLIDQQRKLENGYGKVGQKARTAGDTAKGAFGSAAAQQLKTYALGMVSITAAVTGIRAAIQGVEEISNRAASKAQASRLGMSSLAQLAENPAEMTKLVALAKQTYARGATLDLGSAAKMIFMLQSAGALEQVDLFTQLGARGLVEDPMVMARAAATLQMSMGQKETSGIRALVSKAFGASKFSPATAESLLEAASRGGGSAKALGMRDEELLAATSILSAATGSAEAGATQIYAYLKSLQKQGGYEGLSLDQSLTKIEALHMTGPKQLKYFGRAEGLAGYRTLILNRDLYRQAVEEVDQAEAQDRVATKLALPGGVPEIAAAEVRQAGEAARELAEEPSGTLRNLSDGIKARRAADRAQRRGRFGQWFGGVSEGVERLSQGDTRYIRNEIYSRINQLPTEQVEPALKTMMPATDQPADMLKAYNQIMQRLDASATNLAAAADNLQRKTSGGRALAPIGADQGGTD